MEPEIIVHMKKLSLQGQDLNEINSAIELNKKIYCEQFFSSNVNSTNDLIVHLKRLSIKNQNNNNNNNNNNKDELQVVDKVQKIDNVNNLKTFENKDNQNDSIIKLPIVQTSHLSKIVEDSKESNGSHTITVGHFMRQTFEKRDSHNPFGGLISPTTNSTNGSVKSFVRSFQTQSSQQSQNPQKSQQREIETNFQSKNDKRSDGMKKKNFIKKGNKRNKSNTFDFLTPRTWNSWTSSTLSSISRDSFEYFPNQQTNHHIPWEKLINKEIPLVDNVTNLYGYAKLFEPHHGIRHGMQRKFHLEAIKNAQWPSNDFFTCLLCDQPGHFCHECKFYDCNTFHSDHLSSKTLLDVIRVVDYSIKSSNIKLEEKSNTSLTLVNDTSNSFHKIDNNVKKESTSLHKCFPSKNPLLPIYNEVEFKNSKDSEMLAHVYKIKQVRHNHRFGLPCKKLFKTKKQKHFNCLLCRRFGHPISKCHLGPYCKYLGKLNSRSCKYNFHQGAQMSFRTNQDGISFPSMKANLDHQQWLCYRAPTKMYKVENFGKTKSLDVRKINVYDSMYKVFEEDYKNFFTSSNKNNSSIMHLLKSKESVSVIVGKVNGKETTMLIDTGSTITSITEEFVEQLNLQPWYTNHILTITLANTQVEEYSERLCIITLEVGDVECCETLTVLPGQLYDITLGKNWLKAHMAICDHGLDILRIPGSRPIKMGLTPL